MKEALKRIIVGYITIAVFIGAVCWIGDLLAIAFIIAATAVPALWIGLIVTDLYKKIRN